MYPTHRELLHVLVTAALLCCLAADVAYADDDAADAADNIMAVTCCERVESAWSVLRSWTRTCSSDRGRADASVKRYATMLAAQSRSKVPWLSMPHVCDGKQLSREAVEAFFEHAFCGLLPSTHTDLVHSSYSLLMESAPLDDDALTSGIEEACTQLQKKWVKEGLQWGELLSGRNDLGDAHRGLCPRSCTWVSDVMSGGAYDL
ncbi:hypothetical protein NESM_000163500 [Novymonas esmeraldas]|uniref:Uncharacterized protein n=1 Tax=Novymonas esmeraldas TaxID=1808958 RepID=A0AAW0F5T7_9TRYP